MKTPLILLTLLTFACATKPPIDDASYRSKIDKYSDGEVEYHGFQNTFKFRATIHNNFVQDTYIEQKAKIYKWDESKTQEELNKLKDKNKAATTVFVSFFTPRRDDDNLAKKSKSIWSVYLQTPTGRYEGKVSKYNVSATEIMVLYPYHSPWASAYTMEFPVPLESIENNSTRLIIAGPLGSKEVVFPAL